MVGLTTNKLASPI